MSGEQDHRNVSRSRVTLQILNQLPSVTASEREVGDDDIWVKFPSPLAGLLSIRGFDCRETEQAKALDVHVPSVGMIVDVADVRDARKPSFRLTIDFGRLGMRQSVAALKTDYEAQNLLRRQVVCVFNLPPPRVAGVKAEVLVLAATQDDGTLRLLSPEPAAELGSLIT